jgi:hypothetical protein
VTQLAHRVLAALQLFIDCFQDADRAAADISPSDSLCSLTFFFFLFFFYNTLTLITCQETLHLILSEVLYDCEP